MEINKQNISIGAIVFLFVLGGLLLFFQQRSISQLRQEIQNNQSSSKINSAATASSLKNASVENRDAIVKASTSMADSIEKNTRNIQGKVIQISANSLTVEANLLDKNKMIEIASSPELSKQYQDKDAPTQKKTFTVAMAGDTKFSADKLSDIKAGDEVMVIAKELVYQTDKLTAVSIISPLTSAPPAGN